MLRTYTGSCHCGVLKFEADLDLAQSTYRCNCSICRRTRFWPAVAGEGGFRILCGEDQLTRYTFNSHKNHHFFCRHCGVRAFGVGNDTPMGRMYGVNLGCIDGLSEQELSELRITCVDGMHDRLEPPQYSSHL